MAERIAVFPGCFDPPHKGHIDTVRQILQTGKADHVVVVSGSNPQKKRLLTLENSVELFRRMLPPELADRVTVCADDERMTNMPKLAGRFNAGSLVRGKRRTEHPVKNLIQEGAIAAYLTGYRLARLKKPLHLIWLKNSPDCNGLSSTQARGVLFSEGCSQEKLEKLMPADVADILLRAKAQCPDVSRENNGEFNKALAGLLGIAEAPKAAVKRRAGFRFGRR